GIGSFAEDLAQGIHLLLLDWQNPGATSQQTAATVLRHVHRAQMSPRSGHQFPQPEPLGPVVENVKIGPVPTVARAPADGCPIGGFVASARVSFRVGETL